MCSAEAVVDGDPFDAAGDGRATAGGGFHPFGVLSVAASCAQPPTNPKRKRAAAAEIWKRTRFT
jgi:hypothetical protein